MITYSCRISHSSLYTRDSHMDIWQCYPVPTELPGTMEGIWPGWACHNMWNIRRDEKEVIRRGHVMTWSILSMIPIIDTHGFSLMLKYRVLCRKFKGGSVFTLIIVMREFAFKNEIKGVFFSAQSLINFRVFVNLIQHATFYNMEWVVLLKDLSAHTK